MDAFVRNAWYLAAWSHEVSPSAIVAKRLLNSDLILFRDSNDEVRALEDRCPHRHVPLRLGSMEQGAVQCAYHGLRFDGSGACIHNPHGATIPRHAAVRSYPTRAAGGGIWVWMGEAAAAAEELPVFAALNGEPCYVARDHIHVAADYLLALDNILDLSHLQFLHPTTLGGTSAQAARIDTGHSARAVWVTRQLDGLVYDA